MESTNRQLQTKLDELQLQFNKVVEENVRLQSTQRRSPTATTPTSPLPVIMEPVMVDERKEKGDAPTELYAQVKVCYSWLICINEKNLLIFYLFRKHLLDLKEIIKLHFHPPHGKLFPWKICTLFHIRRPTPLTCLQL